MSRSAHKLLFTALSAILIAVAPAAAQAAATGKDWTRLLDVGLSRNELGLPQRASAARLARAVLDRNAERLGLPRSSKLRLASDYRLPRSAGGRAIRQLRFQQTASGLRVVWSQIDVAIAAGDVSSLSATVVPVKRRATGKAEVSRAQALRIARRAVPKAEVGLRPLPAAYAGTPSNKRAAKWRRPKRVWVVELQPPARPDDDAPSALCVVVDAQSGRVIARWPGMADRPDSGPNARGAGIPGASVAAVGDPRDRKSRALVVFDATGQEAPPPIAENFYAAFDTTGSTRVSSSWPSYLDARDSFGPRSADMDAISANAANVARTTCVVRGYCGRQGGFQPGATGLQSWVVMGNTTGPSHTSRSSLYVWIFHDSIALGTGSPRDPNLAFNDVVAHEFGHVMDFVYAGDRLSSSELSLEGNSVEEALADMFAFDYDRLDATIGEETTVGKSRDWEEPGRISRGGQPYPAHMDDYDPTPPIAADGKPSEHFNSTILSHAYYLFVQRVGHAKAGRVLHNVPAGLGPRPDFQQVADAFWLGAQEIYENAVAGSAASSFGAVGLRPSIFDPCLGLPRPSPKCPR
jgi:Zn-dependent metalloprotease